jgi:hypothetical protein
MAGLRAAGAHVETDAGGNVLSINDEIAAELVLCRCHETRAGSRRWIARLDSHLRPDIRIVVRMEFGETSAHDYYLLPSFDLAGSCLRLAERNEAGLDAYRFNDLQALYELMRRVSLKDVA